MNRDSDGEIHVRLRGVSKLDAVSASNVEAFYTVDRSSGEYRVECGERTYRYASVTEFEDAWMRVYEPFVPRREFPREVRSDDYLFAVVPDVGSQYEELQVVVDGECTPLSEYGVGKPGNRDGRSTQDSEGTVTGMQPVSETSSQDDHDERTNEDLIL